MKLPKFTRPGVLISTASTLLVLGILVRVDSIAASQVTSSALNRIFASSEAPESGQSSGLEQLGAGRAPRPVLPVDLGVALAQSMGIMKVWSTRKHS